MDDLAIAKTKAFYERFAEEYVRDRDTYFLDAEAKVFADFFLQYHSKSATLLDIGCANALRYPSLKKYLPHVHYCGIDIAQSFVQMARARYPHLCFYEGNIADWDTLPQKERFAGIWCSAVIQHVLEPYIPLALTNLYRLLTPNGIAYVSFPLTHTKSSKRDTRHFTLLSTPKQQMYLGQSGFKVRYQGETHGYNVQDRWLSYIVQRA